MYNINTLSTATLKFDPDKVMPLNEDVFDILPSEWHRRFRMLSPAGSYVISSDAHRPDLVSYKIYGHVQYKLLLMQYNLILTVNDFKAGLRITFPSLVDMEASYMAMPAEKPGSTKWTTTPINEAESLRLALLQGRTISGGGISLSQGISTTLGTQS